MSETTRDGEFEFISGPSLAELRGNDAACEEAARVLQETGVDVLSSKVLDSARQRHLFLRRKVMRAGWLCALPGTFALCGLLFCLVLWGDGDTRAGNILALVSVGAAVVCAALSILPRRAEKARKAAIADYKTAYERVVSAAFKSRRNPIK